MDSREFAKTIEKRVAEFCASLDAKLAAYSYIPLTTDEMHIKVMQSRLFEDPRRSNSRRVYPRDLSRRGAAAKGRGAS